MALSRSSWSIIAPRQLPFGLPLQNVAQSSHGVVCSASGDRALPAPHVPQPPTRQPLLPGAAACEAAPVQAEVVRNDLNKVADLEDILQERDACGVSHPRVQADPALSDGRPD